MSSAGTKGNRHENSISEGSGGLYNNQKHPRKTRVNADRPAGEWNTFHIVMKGDKVTIHLNGRLVVDDVPLENYWQRGQPLPARGPIELQHHGDRLWFKNIYIKEYRIDRWPTGFCRPVAAKKAGFRTLWDRRSASGG
jgi:hypothetical protein